MKNLIGNTPFVMTVSGA